MAWSIEFDPHARRELNALDRQVAKRISRFLFERIAQLDDPRSIGETLSGPELGKYWKYRMGDYRIVVHIEDNIIRILAVRIGHRSKVYR